MFQKIHHSSQHSGELVRVKTQPVTTEQPSHSIWASAQEQTQVIKTHKQTSICQAKLYSSFFHCFRTAANARLQPKTTMFPYGEKKKTHPPKIPFSTFFFLRKKNT